VRLATSRGGPDSARDLWGAVVETSQFLGDAIEYWVRIRDRLLRARCERGVHFAIGDPVSLVLRDKACTVVAD
jgi:hypothetical protein